MAIEFVKCRHKDDHSLVHDIARQALRRWPDWEPIPDDEGAQPAQPAESPASTPDADAAKPTTSKSRSKAATDPKE